MPATSPATATAGSGDLTVALRGNSSERQVVDTGLAGGLREWLEDGVAGPLATMPSDAAPLVVDARSLSGGPEVSPGVRRSPSLPLVRVSMVAALFRQLVTTGHVGDPMVDALDALAAQDRHVDLAAFATRLGQDEREALAMQVAADVTTMERRWTRIPPAWLPRAGERLTVPLAGGRAVLVGMADLVLGAPPVDRSSVCLVEVRSSAPAAHHRRGRTFLGLLETLRSGAPPFRVATYYAASGVLDAEEPRDEDLGALVRAVIASTADRCRTLVGEAA